MICTIAIVPGNNGHCRHSPCAGGSIARTRLTEIPRDQMTPSCAIALSRTDVPRPSPIPHIHSENHPAPAVLQRSRAEEKSTAEHVLEAALGSQHSSAGWLADRSGKGWETTFQLDTIWGNAFLGQESDGWIAVAAHAHEWHRTLGN